MPEILDAHHHFWDLKRSEFDYRWLSDPKLKKISRSYLPPDLQPRLKQAGVQRSIFVQTQHRVQENRWVLKLTEEHPFIAGVVGWVDLCSEAVESQLLEFTGHPKFVGVRHVVQDEPDADWIIRPAVLRGLRALQKHRVPYDLLFYTQHLKHAATLARELPELPMVIDHLAKPKIKAGRTEGWIDDLKAAARHPNLYCKLSGLVTEADWDHWKPGDLKPYVDIALEAFGPQRCMFGSDWPVCELAASYGQVMDALREVLGKLAPGDEEAIFSGTARQFYRIPEYSSQ